jgi:hypothetical protein
MHTQPGLSLSLKTKRNDVFFRRFHEIVNAMRLPISLRRERKAGRAMAYGSAKWQEMQTVS